MQGSKPCVIPFNERARLQPRKLCSGDFLGCSLEYREIKLYHGKAYILGEYAIPQGILPCVLIVLYIPHKKGFTPFCFWRIFRNHLWQNFYMLLSYMPFIKALLISSTSSGNIVSENVGLFIMPNSTNNLYGVLFILRFRQMLHLRICLIILYPPFLLRIF